MRRMKASEWRMAFFAEPRPSETWLTKQLREGGIPGEKLGGIWFVHVQDVSIDPDFGNAPANDENEAAASALIEDWINGAASPQQKAS